MYNRSKAIIWLTGAGALLTVAAGRAGQPAQAAGPSFLGSPFLILGILAGVIAILFAGYSALQLQGGRMAPVFAWIGLGLLLLDLGVIAVTFFEMNPTTTLVHDVGLLAGFLAVLLGFYRMRAIVR